VHVEQAGAGPPLLLLHGFTGSARSWDGVRPGLASYARLILPDLVGHGASPKPDDLARYSFEACVADLVQLLDDLAIDRAHVLGYSMGGRVALHLALAHPDRVRSLLLESASPGIEDPVERAARIAADEALAQRIETHGIAAFVDEWERQPLLALADHASAEVRAEQHAQRLQNDPLGLAMSLRGMGAGQQRPLWSELPRLSMPVSLLVGERDTRYCAIAERMLPLLPKGELTIAERAGHTVHLDQPDVFHFWLRAALARAGDYSTVTGETSSASGAS
jgi:2-succinyl-6-hydroxy-2,4-cyclohexadiene-1-carboxylate synthase